MNFHVFGSSESKNSIFTGFSLSLSLSFSLCYFYQHNCNTINPTKSEFRKFHLNYMGWRQWKSCLPVSDIICISASIYGALIISYWTINLNIYFQMNATILINNLVNIVQRILQKAEYKVTFPLILFRKLIPLQEYYLKLFL